MLRIYWAIRLSDHYWVITGTICAGSGSLGSGMASLII